MSVPRWLKYSTLVVCGLAMVYGIGLICLGRPTNHDRYQVIEDDGIEFVPARCALNGIGLGCRPEFLRLEGIDMFEPAQTCRDARNREWPCGAVAADRLRTLVAAQDFSCRVDPGYFDVDGRAFAYCVAEHKDVGATLVNEGLAFAYGRALQYLSIETKAKAERRGAWAGQFVRPQYYRQGARE